MHIKLLYRKVLYVFLSVMIVIANTQTAYAASPVGWSASPADVIMNGASATITAIKGSGSSALQSTIKHAPDAGRIAKHIVKVGGVFAVGMAISQILGDGVDYVLDPANNRVKYVVPPEPTPTNTEFRWLNGFGEYHLTPNQCIAGMIAGFGGGNRQAANIRTTPDTITFDVHFNGAEWINNQQCYRGVNPDYVPDVVPPKEKYIPYSQVAEKIRANAGAGNVPSQELIKTVALEDLESGALDVPLNTNAIPKADNPPITDPNNPPVTDPNAPPVPFDPSSIIAAIKSVMAAVVNMSGVLGAKIDALMIDLGLKHEEKLSADAANTAAIVSAIQVIEGNMLTGEVINDAVDKVIANDNAKVGDIVAAIEAIEGNTLDGQVINDAIDRVIANDNANAQSAADAATAAAEAAKAADAANTAAVTDAIGAQTDAITTTDPTTGEKSLKLPAFCGFAPVVCEYITWVKGEYGSVMEWVKAEPETMPDDPIVVADDPSGLGNIFQDKAEAGYVSFESSCPADVLIPVDLMGASQTLTISYTPFCHFASLIRYAVILGAWISGLLIVTGGRSRE